MDPLLNDTNLRLFSITAASAAFAFAVPSLEHLHLVPRLCSAVVLLRHINLAAQCIYSISIFMAGLTVIPFVMGPLDVIFAVVSLYLSALLWAWSNSIDHFSMEWEELTCERESFELLDGAAVG